MPGPRGYLEHAAIEVADLEWHIGFFAVVLDMPVFRIDGPEEAPHQVWLEGGLQLVRTPQFAGPEGRLAHLGFMVEDRPATIAAALANGAVQTERGAHWLMTPDGLLLEFLQAQPGTVAEARAVKPRG